MLFLASVPSTSTTAKVIFVAFLIVSLVFLIHFASPMRLTRVLVAAIDNVANTYLEAIEAGVLSRSDVHTAAMLSSLQIKVSYIREASLRSSLLRFGALCDLFKGRTLIVLGSIREVHELEVHIELQHGRYDHGIKFVPSSVREQSDSRTGEGEKRSLDEGQTLPCGSAKFKSTPLCAKMIGARLQNERQRRTGKRRIVPTVDSPLGGRCH
ncbi:hypothetical protein C8R44DRAFT_738678 [Mycena epipterygia]|nr:hypothetical protein C8R44DRAFT_738678 [Mycena epipterygia]